MTQGIVSFISRGKVLLKIIVGSNGMNAKVVADIIEKAWPITAQEAYDIAIKNKFGCTDCLVVMTDLETIYNDEETLSNLYREKFSIPEFNPRWVKGTADYVIIVSV